MNNVLQLFASTINVERLLRSRTLLLGLWLLLPWTGLQAQIAIAPSDPRIPFIIYERYPAGLSNAAASPSIKVHGDGRVYIDCPPYMKPSGRFELQLTANQVDQLLTQLVVPMLEERSGAMQEEAQSARQYMQETGNLMYSSDGTVTAIQVKLGTFVNKYGSTRNNYRRSFRWNGLQADKSTIATLGLEAPQLNRFAKLEQMLLSIAMGEPAPEMVETTGESMPEPRFIGPSYSGRSAMRGGGQ